MNEMVNKKNILSFGTVVFFIPVALLMVVGLLEIGYLIYYGYFFNPFPNVYNLPLNALALEMFIGFCCIVCGGIWVYSEYHIKPKYIVVGGLFVFISVSLCCLIIHLGLNAMC